MIQLDERSSKPLYEQIIEQFKLLVARGSLMPEDAIPSVRKLASQLGITPSTVYSMLHENRRDLSIITIKKLCDGLDMSLGEFFSTPEFDALEQEIK